MSKKSLTEADILISAQDILENRALAFGFHAPSALEKMVATGHYLARNGSQPQTCIR